MIVFFLSNVIISLVTILYFRYFTASITAKLWLSIFAAICWIIPFTLIRTYLPQEIAIEFEWLPAIKTAVTSQIAVDQSKSIWNHLRPLNLLLFASVFGLFLFASKLYNYVQWHKKIRNERDTKLLGYTNGIAYYSSPRINHAILIGYIKPTIWLNPKLAHSEYLDILLAHELTHAKHKDNYWLLILEVFSSVYWWNPIFKLLSQQIKDGLESRCDFHTSRSFPKNKYREKLIALVLLSAPICNPKFASAIISKTSNIRRLKMLKEKQIMNPLSKLIISSVFVSCVALLTFPVSSIRAIGSSEPSPNNPVSIDPEAMGVKLDLDIEAITASEGIESKSESTMTLWTKSGESKNLKINQRIDIELSAKIRPNDIILIESKIYWHSENQPRILRASPRLFTKDGNPAIIKTWSDNPDDELPLFRMKVLPNKMKYSEFKP